MTITLPKYRNKSKRYFSLLYTLFPASLSIQIHISLYTHGQFIEWPHILHLKVYYHSFFTTIIFISRWLISFAYHFIIKYLYHLTDKKRASFTGIQFSTLSMKSVLINLWMLHIIAWFWSDYLYLQPTKISRFFILQSIWKYYSNDVY